MRFEAAMSTEDSKLIQNFVERNLTPHIDTILHHSNKLRSSLQDCSTDDLENLERVVKSTRDLQNKLKALTLSTLNDNDIPVDQTHVKIRHDLRTSLNAIFGFTEIILESEDSSHNPEKQEHCSAIIAAANSVTNSVDLLSRKLTSTTPSHAHQLGPNPDITNHLQRISQQSDANKQIGRVLVVDDIEVNRQLLKVHLTTDGHEVSVAESGTQAMEMIDYLDFDLILLDIMMPGMNGLEVLERLKNSEKHKQIPIIVISGLGEMDAVAPCIAAGAEDYLTKPFNPVLLRARINSSLQKKKWGDMERGYILQIEREKNRTDSILQAILPSAIIDRLKQSDSAIADRIENVTVMFADIVGFTSAAEQMTPEGVLEWLDSLFSEMDRLTVEHEVEKIKTIGDAYMVACGAPLPKHDHVDRVLDFASSVLALTDQLADFKERCQLRIGIHTGPVVAGLVGRHRYVYDLWGETVNIASRIESNGLANRICVSNAVARLSSQRFEFKSRGEINLKGIGSTEILTLT